MTRRAAPASRAAALAAARAVYDRRAALDGQRLELFPDEGADLEGVLLYLSANRRAPAAVLTADALAALVIADHLRGEADRWQARCTGWARELGVTWQALAPLLGVTTAQGAEQAHLRALSAHEGGVRDERVVRAARAHTRALAGDAGRSAAVLRRLVEEFADPGLGLPPDLAEDAEDLWTDLTGVPADAVPGAALVAGVRLLVRAVLDGGAGPRATALARSAAVALGLPLREEHT